MGSPAKASGSRRSGQARTARPPPTGAPPDAFLSYAREDFEVARRLHDGLTASGKTVWIDTQDVPFSVSWRDRAVAGIDAAGAVVLVLSGHWATSPSCAFELEHARAAGKRLVPVDVGADPGELPADVADLNWIREPAGDTVAQLVATLDADLPWREAHARLLVRAREWERRGHDASLLLRGSDLREAEAWLDRSPQHEQPPTALHSSYVLAGRRAASRRLRLVLLGVGAALVVTLASAVVATWQRGVADDRAREARAERDRAQSRELAATARLSLRSDSDAALLTALRGLELARTTEARSALISALAASPRLVATFRGHAPGALVSDVAFASGAQRIASAGEDAVRVWARNGRALHTYRGAHSVAFHPVDGTLLASGGAGVRLWRGERPAGRPLGLARGRVRDLAWARGGGRLAAAGGGQVRVWRMRGADALGPPRRHAFPDVEALAFSPDGRVLAAASGENGSVRLLDARTAERRGPRLRQALAAVTDLGFAAGGSVIVATGAGGRPVAMWDRRTGHERPAPSLETPAFGLAARGRTLAVGGADGVIRVWRGLRNRPTALAGHVDAVQGLSLSRNGRLLASVGSDASVRVWDVARPVPLGDRRPAPSARPAAVALAADGRTAVGAARGAALWVAQGGPWIRASTGRAIEALALSHDGGALATVDAQGVVRSGPPGAPAARLGQMDPIEAVLAVAPGGDAVAAGSLVEERLRLWAAGRKEPITLDGSAVAALAFSADGLTLGAGRWDGAIMLWDVERREARTVDEDDGDLTRSLAFGPDRPLLAAGMASGAVKLFDTAGRRSPRASRAHRIDVTALAFSRDGRTLAAGAADGTTRLLDVATLRPLGDPLRAPGGMVSGLAFDRDGALVSLAASGALTRWDPLLASDDVSAWRERVQRLTGRP